MSSMLLGAYKSSTNRTKVLKSSRSAKEYYPFYPCLPHRTGDVGCSFPMDSCAVPGNNEGLPCGPFGEFLGSQGVVPAGELSPTATSNGPPYFPGYSFFILHDVVPLLISPPRTFKLFPYCVGVLRFRICQSTKHTVATAMIYYGEQTQSKIKKEHGESE